LTSPGYAAQGSNGPQDRSGQHATMYGVSKLKLGLFGANCSPAGQSRWCRNAGSALLAQLVIVSLGGRCRARRQCRSCFYRGRGRGLVLGASTALASGVASPLTGVASLPGFSSACERPCRSFHPTAVEGRNGPPASRWVENKFNEIELVRQIEREVPHISLVVLSCCAAARTWHPVRRRSRPAAQNWRATVSADRPRR
jgi:hypothetical protein